MGRGFWNVGGLFGGLVCRWQSSLFTLEPVLGLPRSYVSFVPLFWCVFDGCGYLSLLIESPLAYVSYITLNIYYMDGDLFFLSGKLKNNHFYTIVFNGARQFIFDKAFFPKSALLNKRLPKSLSAS